MGAAFERAHQDLGQNPHDLNDIIFKILSIKQETYKLSFNPRTS